MHTNNLSMPQGQSGITGNIFADNAEDIPSKEYNFPLLEKVDTVSGSPEDFNTPGIKHGHSISLAVQEKRDRNISSNNKPNNCSIGWKIVAAIAGVAGALGGVALYARHVLNTSSTGLMPVDESMTPIIDNNITEPFDVTLPPDSALNPYDAMEPRQSEGDGPRMAMLQSSKNVAQEINDEINSFKNHFHSLLSKEVLTWANYLNGLIRNNAYDGTIAAGHANIIAKKLAYIYTNQITPLFNRLNRDIATLKRAQLSDSINLLHINAKSLEMHNINDARRIIINLIRTLNHMIINRVSYNK